MEWFFSRYLNTRESCSWQDAELVTATPMVFLLFFTFLRSPDTTWWFKSELSSGQFSSCIEKYWNEFFQRGDRSCDCFYFTPVVHFNTLMSAVCDWAGPRIAVLPSKPGMSSFVSIASSGSAIRQGCALCVRGAEEGQSQWFLYIVTSLPWIGTAWPAESVPWTAEPCALSDPFSWVCSSSAHTSGKLALVQESKACVLRTDQNSVTALMTNAVLTSPKVCKDLLTHLV